MNNSNKWPLILIASGIAIGIIQMLDVEGPIRPLLAFWFLLICPGMAFVPLLKMKQALIELTTAIALSLTLNTIVAEIMIYTDTWSDDWAVAVLIAITIIGAVLQLMSPIGEARGAK